jgi:hypothetical protein
VRMMVPPIRAERKARGWTVPVMARKLRDAADDPRDVPGLESIIHNIFRWETGKFGISERYRNLYCRALDRTEYELFGIESGESEIPVSDSGNQYVLLVLPKGSQMAVIDLTGANAGQGMETIPPQIPQLAIVKELTMGRQETGTEGN